MEEQEMYEHSVKFEKIENGFVVEYEGLKVFYPELRDFFKLFAGEEVIVHEVTYLDKEGNIIKSEHIDKKLGSV